jgi:hypothetical protein
MGRRSVAGVLKLVRSIVSVLARRFRSRSIIFFRDGQLSGVPWFTAAIAQHQRTRHVAGTPGAQRDARNAARIRCTLRFHFFLDKRQPRQHYRVPQRFPCQTPAAAAVAPPRFAPDRVSCQSRPWRLPPLIAARSSDRARITATSISTAIWALPMSCAGIGVRAMSLILLGSLPPLDRCRS